MNNYTMRIKMNFKKLLFLLIFPLFISAGEKKDVLSVAIVRNDGILTPIQRFENNQWIDIKNKFDKWNNEFIEEWVFYSNFNEKSILKTGDYVHINFLADYDDYGFISEYQKVNIGESYEQKTVEGIAFSLDISLKMAKRIDNSFPEWIEINNLLSKFPINIDSTNERVRRYFSNSNFGKFLKLNLSNLWLLSNGKQNIYFFYSSTETDNRNCPTILLVQGWIISKENSFTIGQYDISIDDCDGKFLSQSLTPLAKFSYVGESYILFQVLPYEGIEYRIINEKNLNNIFKLYE